MSNHHLREDVELFDPIWTSGKVSLRKDVKNIKGKYRVKLKKIMFLLLLLHSISHIAQVILAMQ